MPAASQLGTQLIEISKADGSQCKQTSMITEEGVRAHRLTGWLTKPVQK